MILERAIGIELTSEAGKLAPRAGDTSQQFGSPRNKAQEKAGKRSSVDEAEFRRKRTVLTPIDSNGNLAKAATSSFAVSRESRI
jgi:hypothetical protein